MPNIHLPHNIPFWKNTFSRRPTAPTRPTMALIERAGEHSCGKPRNASDFLHNKKPYGFGTTLITVGYSAQKTEWEGRIRELSPAEAPLGLIEVRAIDDSPSHKADLVLVDLTRTDKHGFLDAEERLAVMSTRARLAMVILTANNKENDSIDRDPEDFKRACAGKVLKLTDANVNKVEEHNREVEAAKLLYDVGMVLSRPHPLDHAVAFKGHDLNTAREGRFVPWECQPTAYKQQPDRSTTYPYFALPAFGLTGMTFTDSVWKAVDSFRKANSTTYITHVQILYAALVYFWLQTEQGKQREPIRSAVTSLPDVKIKPPILNYAP
ncbi:hypothetical protein QQX98_009492 [Neonectria punicea]|uniref:DNA2/NAM7 helicase-like C-terminal domain-containing protein n=1 Tax=Neonectria punicea TaxID=979145 RepID=A0ABR1GSG1_9HYPO